MSRYTVVYEGDPTGVRILSGEAAPGRAIGVMLGDSIGAQEEIRRLTRERDRAMEQANEADARVVAIATEKADLVTALRNVQHSAAGGNAIKSTADLLRWVAPRIFATHGDGEVPSERVIRERATMLDAADRTIRAAIARAEGR